MVIPSFGVLHNGHTLTVLRRRDWFERGGYVVLVCEIIELSFDLISSRRESSAWDISGFIVAKVLDCSSVPYLCLRSCGNFS